MRTVLRHALFLPALIWAATAAAAAPGEGMEPLAGRVFFQEQPFAGAVVSAYAAPGEGFRGEPAGQSTPTGEDGIFSLTLPRGEYYLVARKGGTSGGESYFGLHRSPIATGAAVDDGYVVQVVRPHALERQETAGSPGRVKGRVLGPGGPVSGAAVLLYVDPGSGFRGPSAIALQGPEGTDGEGRFSVELDEGTYYLVALRREGDNLRGPPRPGDLWGYFDGNPLEIRSGVTLSLDLQTIAKLDPAKVSPSRIGEGATGIRGTVRSIAGKVPAGAFVYAVESPDLILGSLPPYRTVIDGEGTFTLQLPPGIYYLAARSAFGPPQPGEWYGVHGDDPPVPVTVGEKVVEEIAITVDQLQ